ncbi:MAG: hypothetical protein Q8K78_08990, partial [Planctomycetaceae bacterium]|nr:hypothetical protein [Planctomycetaceae bacterium]
SVVGQDFRAMPGLPCSCYSWTVACGGIADEYDLRMAIGNSARVQRVAVILFRWIVQAVIRCSAIEFISGNHEQGRGEDDRDGAAATARHTEEN